MQSVKGNYHGGRCKLPKPKAPLIVDVTLRCALAPAEGMEPYVSNNDMLSDLNTYLKLKEHDTSLQCNGTRIQVISCIKQVFGGLE